jgi:hypothetical protein
VPGAETFRAATDAYDRHVGRYGAQLADARECASAAADEAVRDGLVRRRHFASRSTTTAEPRCTTRTAVALGVGDGPFDLRARAWAVAGIAG